MSENVIDTILVVLYIMQLPLLIGVCIYNAKTVKKKDRAAAPFVWRTIGLAAAAFLGSMLLWALLHFPLSERGYAEGFLSFFLTLCGLAASVLIAKRALSGEDERKKRLARSLRPEHFTNGRTFSRPAFEHWVLESRRCAKKALTVYVCCIAGGILLSLLFSECVGGFGGNIVAILCLFAGLIAGGVLSKNTGRSADNAAACLGVSRTDVATAKRNLKNGTVAWRDETPDKDGDAHAENATPAETETPPETADEQPAKPHKSGKRPRKKMKKWQKITLIATGGLVVLFLCIDEIAVIANKTRETNEAAYYDCMCACDMTGAQEYADKLTKKNDTQYQDKVDQMERFLALFDAGSWQEAIDEYNRNELFILDGTAMARYCECYYQTQVLPAETALDEGRVSDAIELLLQFQNRFYWYSRREIDTKTYNGSFKEYSEYFKDHSQHFIELTERAAEAALAAGDEDTILLLEGFHGDTVNTVPFDEFPWSEDYLEWKAAREAENEPAAEEDAG